MRTDAYLQHEANEENAPTSPLLETSAPAALRSRDPGVSRAIWVRLS